MIFNKKKTLEIRNMSPKNVIKIINIQKCYLGHIGVNVHGSSKSKKQKEDDNGWISHNGRKVEDDFQHTISLKVKHTNAPFHLTRSTPFLSDSYLSLWSDETMSSWLWIGATNSGAKSSYNSG